MKVDTINYIKTHVFKLSLQHMLAMGEKIVSHFTVSWSFFMLPFDMFIRYRLL